MQPCKSFRTEEGKGKKDKESKKKSVDLSKKNGKNLLGVVKNLIFSPKDGSMEKLEENLSKVSFFIKFGSLCYIVVLDFLLRVCLR